MLTFGADCGIILVSRGESEWRGRVTTDHPNEVENASARKTLRRSALKKKVKKPLDKSLKV
jgi:hypothetical protein